MQSENVIVSPLWLDQSEAFSSSLTKSAEAKSADKAAECSMYLLEST